VLPFGVLHGFVTWFNGVEEEEDEYEYEDEEEEYEDEEGELEGDSPRTIRFRRRDIDTTEEGVIGAPASEEEGEEEYEEEENDGEAFEEIESDTETIEVAATTKAPDPLLEEAEDEEPVAEIPKPHFKIRKPKAKPEKEPTEREVVMNQLNAAVDSIAPLEDYELPSIQLLENSTKAGSLEKGRNPRDDL